ncbi:MAG: hypothetical protein HOI47_10535 [Candidatus Scalindua sp.]|jgi:hypothetical protein|nr:hypothetical protein [Candidatus Scalindua sp.]MBT5304335.1 hypothetical protein [Candidatus Scalindua sp.]MBT6227082.1 hypothetical protein [Candidatus Scalindua sp.]MBT7213297.1 hypothetical protein [Candidatus Scalindua sp.]MBT7589794.1 hypothetical protein [Candidatus Scalindua sp.]
MMLLLLLPIGQALGQHDEKYSFKYPGDFFNYGGEEVEFDASVHRKIGVLVSNRTTRPLSEITHMIFNTSPFYRYKPFFYFRIAEKFREDMANNNTFSTRAYDYSGRPLNGGLPTSEGRGSFNLTFLTFGMKEVIQCSCNGATIHTNQGNFSYAGEDSILHEIGHAFAELADEYSHSMASNFTAVNLENRGVHTPKWNGLIEQGILPGRLIKRIETVNGFDKVQFLIPSNNCFMNNHRNPEDDRYCPVCQLAIIDRISQLSGVALPWE